MLAPRVHELALQLIHPLTELQTHDGWGCNTCAMDATSAKPWHCGCNLRHWRQLSESSRAGPDRGRDAGVHWRHPCFATPRDRFTIAAAGGGGVARFGEPRTARCVR